MQIDVKRDWYGPFIDIQKSTFNSLICQKDFKKIGYFTIANFHDGISEIPKLSRKSTGQPFPDWLNSQLYLNSKVCEFYSKSFMPLKEKALKLSSPAEYFVNFQTYMFSKTTLSGSPHFLKSGPSLLPAQPIEFYQFKYRIQIALLCCGNDKEALSTIKRAEAKNGDFLKSIKYNLTGSMLNAIIDIEGLSPEMPRSQMLASSIAHEFGHKNSFSRLFNMSPKQFLKEREIVSKNMSKKIDLRKAKDIYKMVISLRNKS